MTLQMFFEISNAIWIFKYRVDAYLARNFAKSSFANVTKAQNSELPMVRIFAKQIKSIFAVKAIVERGFGNLFCYLE